MENPRCRASEELIQDCCLELSNSRKNWVICDEPRRLRSEGGGCLKRVWRPEAIHGAHSRCQVRRFQVRRHPSQVRIRGQQTVECVYALLVVVAIRWNQELRHCDCGGHGLMAFPFHPRKDSICEREVPGIRFYLVNENAGVESDPAVTPEKNPEALYSQL
jgi:hypothetical protein